MHNPPFIQTIHQLHQVGKSTREISRILNISRNSVRRHLRKTEPQEKNALNHEAEQSLIALVVALLPTCRGNLVRVHEVLTQEYQKTVPYSTLTYWVRKYRLTEPESKRFGEYVFEPGLEMQHDTSPHKLLLNGVPVVAQCASLIFGFSRKIFIQYYPCFTRFEAKVFLAQALTFMQGSCRRCIIDNTSVILAAGAGASAVVAPEMLYFSRLFGFEFIAHAVNHPNRKGKIERPFLYAEKNFLAGRTFIDWSDLNQQACLWCETVANHKPKRALGMPAQTAYLQEKPYLLLLPQVMPAIYKHYQRVADTQGYINVDTNRYSIPETTIGYTMDVYQYLDKIDIYYQNKLLATHPRLIGQRGKRSCIKGHHRQLYRDERQRQACVAEQQLSGFDPILDAYLLALKSHVRGRGIWSFNQLLMLKQRYPQEAFMAAIQLAQQYNLYDMKRLETMILKHISSHFFNL